ncbi:hypothetical protein CFIMG_003065RA [Ceratocystis fimbriata CBS 114723]|uniref:Uncharacterized protein n=1 Tax=Ceratocystis fimbriata CBS 114723 TaxID=1035309 RepID=A0A2C5X3E4_9PEZI|nr:hypothetical protein CFIMG_003065RA [Ceratocystis fimbriata CBS 114723]
MPGPARPGPASTLPKGSNFQPLRKNAYLPPGKEQGILRWQNIESKNAYRSSRSEKMILVLGYLLRSLVMPYRLAIGQHNPCHSLPRTTLRSRKSVESDLDGYCGCVSRWQKPAL